MRVRANLLALALALGPAAATAGSPNGIPLCVGLTLVTAISQPEGDYESIKSIISVDTNGVLLKYSTEHPVADFPGGPSHVQKLDMTRLVRIEDLHGAKRYLQQFQTDLPNLIPGTTAIGTSSAVLNALKGQGHAELSLFDLPAPLPGAHKLSADSNAHPGIFDYDEVSALTRVDAHATVPVTVNGSKVELPAVHATGKSDYYGYKSEFFFLDDIDNPLALSWRLRIGSVQAGPKAGSDRDVLRIVKISFQCNAPAGQISALEHELTVNRRAQVFDIYFSFNSAELRKESDRTLGEIAALMRKHPEWALAINGHTDNIAGDAFNLELSKRRAAAVKDALVSRFHIDAARLTTAGFGRSQPVDSNDTEEGRGRNRRVELTR